jgi:hypothetical protein
MDVVGGRARARTDVRRRTGEPRPPALEPERTITVRVADLAQEPALERLGELSGLPTPPGRYLVAEVDGEVWAALPLAGGEPFADPFLPALEVKELLALRRGQLDAQAGSANRDDGKLVRLDDRLVVPRTLVEPR